MSLTATTLAAAIGQNDTLVTLTSSTGIVKKQLLKIDGEWMKITDISLAPTVQVVRGYSGPQGLSVGLLSAATPHNILAPAVFGTDDAWTQYAGDTLANQPVVSYSVSGAITIPAINQLIVLNKGGVAAMTLASPGADSTVTVTIISGTAQAHTVTYTPGFYGDTTSSDVATFAGKVGASMTIQAQQGLWGVVALADVTLG